jgi:hypothetical protein
LKNDSRFTTEKARPAPDAELISGASFKQPAALFIVQLARDSELTENQFDALKEPL